MVVKDNVTSMYSYEETSVLDEEDSSVMRGKTDLLDLIRKAGLVVVEKSFPTEFQAAGIHPVICLVLK